MSKNGTGNSLASTLSSIKKPAYTFLAIVGSLTLATFEYFGLVSESMDLAYKVALGFGIVIIAVAYFKASRGGFWSVLLCFVFALSMLTSAFSGRAQISVQQEKNAQHNVDQKNKINTVFDNFNRAAKAAVEHQTIKDNNAIFLGQLDAVKQSEKIHANSTLTEQERYGPAISALAGLQIYILPSQFVTYISALFTLALFIATGVMARAGLSPTTQKPQGDQMFTNSQNIGDSVGNSSIRTKYANEEAELAVDAGIRKEGLTKVSQNDVQRLIQSFYKSEVGIKNERAAKLAKKKNAELSMDVTEHTGNVIDFIKRKLGVKK